MANISGWVFEMKTVNGYKDNTRQHSMLNGWVCGNAMAKIGILPQ